MHELQIFLILMAMLVEKEMVHLMMNLTAVSFGQQHL
jgi:hypothetical protein